LLASSQFETNLSVIHSQLLMDPQVEIDALKAAIAGYEREYATAISEAMKLQLLSTITGRNDTLKILLQEQQGKVIDFPVTLVQF
jgi:hypothetical protein